MVSARQGPVFARILVVPATRDGLGPFYQDVIAVSPLEPWDAASDVLDAAAERLAELGDLTTADGAVLLHGDFYLGNVLIHGDHVSAEADDLEVTHPLLTLRCLIDAPLPLVATGLY